MSYIKHYSNREATRPVYWSNFIRHIQGIDKKQARFFWCGDVFDLVISEGLKHNLKIIYDDSYKVEFKSEEDYFLFVMEWS